jgi:hypothetical protein
VRGVLGNAEAVTRGLADLLDGLCAYEALLALVPDAVAAHPGRAWQWEPMAAEARRRIALEAEAPLSPEALSALRAGVARRLEREPCRHGEGREATVAAAREAGLDPERLLPWLSALGACCCDCQVVAVRGPREPGRR